MIPAVAMAGIVLLNVNMGMLFRIDAMGAYIKGPWYLCMYYYAFAYGVIVLICSIWRYQKLGSRKFCIILEFLFILGSCVGIQAVYNELLMTGFGLMLGILVLYLTISNPSDFTDPLTGLFNGRSFRRRMQQLYEHKKTFHVIVMDMPQIRKVNMLFGSRFGDDILCKIADKLGKIVGTGYVFRLSGKRFAVVVSALADYENCRKGMADFLSGPQMIGQEQFRVLSAAF